MRKPEPVHRGTGALRVKPTVSSLCQFRPGCGNAEEGRDLGGTRMIRPVFLVGVLEAVLGGEPLPLVK